MSTGEEIIDVLNSNYERLVDYKIYKKTPLIIYRDGRIVKLDPHEVKKELQAQREKQTQVATS